jgi:hypothetical protein
LYGLRSRIKGNYCLLAVFEAVKTFGSRQIFRSAQVDFSTRVVPGRQKNESASRAKVKSASPLANARHGISKT